MVYPLLLEGRRVEWKELFHVCVVVDYEPTGCLWYRTDMSVYDTGTTRPDVIEKMGNAVQ